MPESASNGRRSGLNCTRLSHNWPRGRRECRVSSECRQPTRDTGPWTPHTHGNVCQPCQSHSLRDGNMILPPNVTNDNQHAAGFNKPRATKIRLVGWPPSFIRPMDSPLWGISQEGCGQGRSSRGDDTVAAIVTRRACLFAATNHTLTD